ncbi:MAG TPA: hypothetical protein VEA16_01910 [Vicinamibacterales bacterium]|nr:hypothetical protein [Vicinamibacterales bacterium]
MIASVIKARDLRVGDQLMTGSSVQPWARVTNVLRDFYRDPVWLVVECEHQPTARVSSTANVVILREGPVF